MLIVLLFSDYITGISMILEYLISFVRTSLFGKLIKKGKPRTIILKYLISFVRTLLFGNMITKGKLKTTILIKYVISFVRTSLYEKMMKKGKLNLENCRTEEGKEGIQPPYAYILVVGIWEFML